MISPNAFRMGHWTAFDRCDGRQERSTSLDDDLSAHASKTGVEGPYEPPIVEDVVMMAIQIGTAPL